MWHSWVCLQSHSSWQNKLVLSWNNEGSLLIISRARRVDTIVSKLMSMKSCYSLIPSRLRLGLWRFVCCLSAKSGHTGAEHVARSQLDYYVLFLIHSVIIQCEIRCNFKRVITLLIMYIQQLVTLLTYSSLWPWVCAYATANTAHSIPNDNHSDFKKFHNDFKIIPKIHNDNYEFFKEDYLSNKNLSVEIIGQSPVGNISNFAI